MSATGYGAFVEHQILHNDVPDYRQAPAQTDVSLALSKALKKNGFNLLDLLAMLLCRLWVWSMTMKIIALLNQLNT